MVEKVQVVEGTGLSNVKAVADKYGVNAKGAVSYQQIQSDLAAGTKAPSLGGSGRERSHMIGGNM